MKTYKERLPLIDAAIEHCKWKLDEDPHFIYICFSRAGSGYSLSQEINDRTICTRDEFNQRKAELQKLYEWGADVEKYTFEQFLAENGLIEFCKSCAEIHGFDWQDTLEERPDAKVSAFNVEDYAGGTPDGELSSESDDPVNHPPHYTQHPSGVECIQITEHCNFCIGNAIKYLWRAGLKGAAIEDLKKARWYIEREIDRLESGK